MSAEQLRQEKCRPLTGAEHRLDGEALAGLLTVVPEWRLLDDGKAIGRELGFEGFLPALAFANALGWQAEQDNHHPDLELGWGYVRIRFSSHDVGGLSRNDFISAAKVDALLHAR